MSRSTYIPAGDRPFTVDEELAQWILEIRRHLHQHPELSFQEAGTAAYVQEKLAELEIPSTNGVAKTGVIGVLGGRDASLPAVALRADMDALPVTEETKLSYSSRHPGVMHACGHDGHVAMLLGAAALLKRSANLPGRVKLIFQPAEEHGNGADLLVKAGVVNDVGAIFAGHIDTHFRTGEITVDEGIICAFADPFSIRITGRGGHAARPHEASDAIVAASSLVMIIQTLISREADPRRPQVVTIGSFHGGTVNNVIAGEALLTGTIRSTDGAMREKTIAGLKRMVESLQKMYRVSAEIVFQHGLPAVVNSRRATETARAAAWDTTNVDNVVSQGPPSMGAEDFAFYQQQVESCLVRFGGALPASAGPSHSSTFDFDERCLEVGSRWLAHVAWRWLEQARSVEIS